MYHQLAIGAVAGLVAQSSTYPLEVIRRRMQTSGVIDQHGTAQGVFVKEGHQPLPREKPTISHILSEVMREQGVRGLFKGLSMNWVKGPIAIRSVTRSVV
jgi:solute carrier family 25 protein 42